MAYGELQLEGRALTSELVRLMATLSSELEAAPASRELFHITEELHYQTLKLERLARELLTLSDVTGRSCRQAHDENLDEIMGCW
ncbi:hypothetical protein GCM10023116_44400 [Kistimonas scapharcae]|uniref:Uncharacterized protein n=1 Tax=Kistimonas scapharcae TaxID=1036133 RepID=A0ABP8V8V1_9GAMM